MPRPPLPRWPRPPAGDALIRVRVTPLGEMPGPALAGFTALDILVNGWVASNTIDWTITSTGSILSC